MADPIKFNSSDIELDEPAPNKWQSAGSRSVESIIEHAFDDRLSSKRSSKLLQQVSGAPGTQYARCLWMIRLEAFRVHSLGHDPQRLETLPPSGQDLERFFSSVIKYLRTPFVDTVPSYGCVISSVRSVITALNFKYKDFILSAHDRARLSSTIESLRQQGKITKVPKVKKAWVSAQLIAHLITNTYKRALTEGTSSWDVTLSKITSILFLGAFGCRVGEVVKSHLYQGYKYLQWKCLQVRYSRESTSFAVKDLTLDVTLIYVKKDKYENGKGQKHFFRLNENLPQLCPVQAVLILASRTGVIANIEAALQEAQSRLDRTVQWRAERLLQPVLGAILGAGTYLSHEIPARPQQLLNTVRAAGLAAGIAGRLKPHDLRRGSARDLARVSNKLGDTGVADSTVAHILGHTGTSLNGGITQHYAGGLEADHWNTRLTADLAEPRGAPVVANTPMRKIKLGTSVIDKYMKENGIDPTDHTQRDKAARRLRVTAEKDYVHEAKNALATPVSSTVLSLGKRPLDLAGGDMADDQEDTSVGNDESLAHLVTEVEATLSYQDMTVIDPMLLHSELKIYSSMEFVLRFANINTTIQVRRTSSRYKAQANEIPRSLDDCFQYKCPNEIYGCGYHAPRKSVVTAHALACKFVSVEAGKGIEAARNAKKELPFKCDRKGCQLAYETPGALRNHVYTKHVHSFKPKKCSQCSSTSEQIFRSQNALSYHIRKMHPKMAYVERQCRAPGCENKAKVFPTHMVLESHLKGVHGITTSKEKDKYIYGEAE